MIGLESKDILPNKLEASPLVAAQYEGDIEAVGASESPESIHKSNKVADLHTALAVTRIKQDSLAARPSKPAHTPAQLAKKKQ